jgi:dipeptidyl-peptidase II
MRFHYPNIVSGSIAASAPIYVVTGQSPRANFFEDVTKVSVANH